MVMFWIVTSIVNDILMPLIGLILGGLDFSGLSLQIKDASIAYGAFIQNVIDFLIVALCLFLMIKFVSKLTAKKRAAEEAEKAAKKAAEEEAAAAKAAEKSVEVLLLEEIRDFCIIMIYCAAGIFQYIRQRLVGLG